MIIIYLHICCINNWKSVIDNIILNIKKYNLYEKVKEIRAVILGNRENYIFDKKINIVYESNNKRLYERKILNILYEDSFKEDFNVLYLHSKGVKWNNKNNCVTDWVELLLYFNIKYHEEILNKLHNYDVIGVNLSLKDTVHFSGNFWWSKSNYIKTLNKEIAKQYCGPEFWITQKTSGNFLSVWNSNINHYKNRYPKIEYFNKPLKYISNKKCMDIPKI